MQAGIHFNVPFADYLRDPAPQPSLNASTCNALLSQSPLHAWTQHPRLNPRYKSVESEAMDIGTIVHAILLEGNTVKLVVVDADSWRTKAAKEARANARANGGIPILATRQADIMAMVNAAQDFISGSEIAKDWDDADAEVTLIYNETAGSTQDLWMRARPDKLAKDHSLILDYKTTGGSANPQN